MRHLAKFSFHPEFFKPHRVQCSCGVAGDFATKEQAHDWMESLHFAKLTGIAYGEFDDPSPPPPEEPETQKKTEEGEESLGDA